MTSEEQLQRSISDYIKLQYPKILFNVDLSGIKLTIGQATKVKRLRSGRAFPDMVIYHPNSTFYGLFMELKRETPFRKDGKLKKDAHLIEQAEMLEKLNALGYYADFVWTFEMGKKLIDKYLKLS